MKDIISIYFFSIYKINIQCFMNTNFKISLLFYKKNIFTIFKFEDFFNFNQIINHSI